VISFFFVRKNLFRFLGRIVTRRPWTIVGVAAALTLFMGIVVLNLEFDMTFMRLLDHDKPEVQRFLRAAENYGELSNLILVVEPPDESTGRAFLEEVKLHLSKNPEVKAVESGLPAGFFRKYALWLLPERETYAGARSIRLLGQSVHAGELTAGIIESAMEAEQQAVPGSFGESAIDFTVSLGKWLRGERDRPPALDDAFPEFVSGDGQYQTPGGKIVLLIIRMKKTAMESTVGGPLFVNLLSDLNAAKEKYPSVKAGYTGIYAIGYEDQNGVLQRFKFLSPLSLLLMLGIFFYFTRIPASPLIVGASLAAAVIWTFGLVKFTLGYASLTTLVFAVFLFGLGVDFAVHLTLRYLEERSGDADPDEALRRAIMLAGPGILTGGLTTAAAFFMLLFSDFKGGEHLGLTTGMGMICCLAAGLILFPALVVLWHRHGKRKCIRPPERYARWLDSWAAAVARRPWFTISLCIAFTVALLPFFKHFKIEFDLDRIIFRDVPALDLKKKVEKEFDFGTDFGIAFADDIEQARSKSRLLEKMSAVEKVQSIADFIPEMTPGRKSLFNAVREATPPDNLLIDKEKMTGEFISLPDSRSGNTEIHELAAYLKQHAADPGLAARIQSFESSLRRDFSRMLPLLKFAINIPPPSEDDLPPAIRARYKGKDGRYPLLIYPVKNVMARDNIIEFKKEIRSVCPEATGMMIMFEMMTMAGLERLPLVCALVMIAIGLILYSDFRSIRHTMFALLPVAVASLWTFGLLCAFGVMITIFIGITFPLVVGIGVDDGVHMTHRLRQEAESGGVVEAVSKTGRPILMTTLTTIAGFGILMLTNHNGLIGMGASIALGVALCFVTTITILPAVYTIAGRNKRSDDTAGDNQSSKN